MKETYWGYWLVVLGVFVVVILLLIQNVTSNNTFDEYTIKQITEASLVDAVDYAYYRDYGELKINKEKFVESFWRRFAEVASVRTKYQILITGVYEAPPKVSVEINSKTDSYVIASGSNTFDMVSRINSVLEFGTDGNGSSSTSSSTTSSSSNTNKGTTSSTKEKDTPTITSKVPDKDKIMGFVVVTKQSKYYERTPGTINGMRIKQYYLDNPKIFIEAVLSDYQSFYSINFTDLEKNEFRSNVKAAFYWANK